ncbi:MAG: hypothetical protein HC899_10740 [Leptolyngbyaceae cyanobacterium SM1_4_3]|nr:hypothetical protein [Leptolyngbyaceae cyanobacterium SM1_4_3]
MLSQIVRPMVRTQIRLLANSQATRSTLVNTIAQWLGFLGVRAQVTQIDAVSNQISVSLTVGKPEACDTHDWQQILQNLNQSKTAEEVVPSTQVQMTPQQQSKLQRLLAYVIQVGSSEQPTWEKLYPQLQTLGFEESTLLGIRSALKVPQSLDQLMEGLDSDVAAIALPKAVSIALLDRQVNPSEDKALATLLEAMKQPASA